MKHPERLANAIIQTAVKDYRSYLKKMKKKNMFDDKGEIKQEFMYSELVDRMGSIERFFRSDWFETLCGLDPELLITRIRKEAGLD